MPRGFFPFVLWLTGLALNVEEHTVTQSLFGLDRPHDWKRLHNFVEYGHWNSEVVEDTLAELLETAPGRLWYGYRIQAIDDSKVHRTSSTVWGTCTFHESSARCPNRVQTVRAHNGVVLGALLHNPSQPAWFLPQTGRLDFRRSQLPDGLGDADFQTKCELAVQLLRRQAQAVPGKYLGIFDGAFAVKSVVQPLVRPEDEQPRIAILTRLRHDACLFDRPPAERPRGRRGPPPKWGRRLPPPRRAGQWREEWQQGEVFLDGRWRQVRSKEKICLWKVLGWQTPVKVMAAEVEGDTKRLFLVSTAVDLSGLQLLELFGARFRQEEGFRDLKQRLGWEECRAWTRKPVERTSWARMLTLSLLRLPPFRLESRGETSWWYRPPWNKRKVRPSMLDLERLLRSQREEMLAGLSAYLGSEGETGGPEERERELG